MCDHECDESEKKSLFDHLIENILQRKIEGIKFLYFKLIKAW